MNASSTTHSVDSTTCPLCKSIGGHAPDCQRLPRPACRHCGLTAEASIHNPTATGHAFEVRPAASPFVSYGCPDWCVRWDHHSDVVDADNPPIHYGPAFGLLEVSAEGDGLPQVDLLAAVPTASLSVEDLRKLAADAEAAARWLEAHR